MGKFRLLFYSFIAIAIVILLVFALNLFPIPGQDAVVFLPTALLYAKGFGLANPLYWVTRFTDLTHTNRFNYYVPLFPWLLGMLASIKPGIKTIFFFCASFGIVNLLLYTRVIRGAFPASASALLRATLLLSVPYLVTYLTPAAGRPEIVTTLFIFLVYILYRHRATVPAWLYNSSVCMLFAFMLAAQLISFYFCFLFFVTYELINTKHLGKTIAINAGRFAAVLLLFCAILELSPNGFVNTIGGIERHVSFVFARLDRSFPLFLHYWVFNQLNFGFLFLFVLCAGFYVREIYSYAKALPLINKLLIAGLQLFILYGIYKFILYASPTIYNATQFIMPLMCYLIIRLLAAQHSKFGRLYIAVTLVTLAAGSLVLGRNVLLVADSFKTGKDFDSAREAIGKVMQQYPKAKMTNSLWPLIDDVTTVRFFDGIDYKAGDIIVIQDAYHPFPPYLVGRSTIIYNWSSPGKPSLLGIPLASRPQGYGFVVCRIDK